MTPSSKISVDLKKVERRNKLKPRDSNEPYWQPLGAKRYLGFRPSSGNGQGTWLARYYDPVTGKKPNRALGDFGLLPLNERFDAARKAASEWFDFMESGGTPEVITVAEACRRYGKKRPAEMSTIQRHVLSDPIANVVLPKLMTHHLKDWRARLTKEKLSVASINRYMVPLRAALNEAKDNGYVLTDRAWRTVLRPEETNARRELYLTAAERQTLLAELPEDLSRFCRCLCLLPVRPGALAQMRVKDFNHRTNEVTVYHDKTAAARGRKIALPDAHAAFFLTQAYDKATTDPLFSDSNGKLWTKDRWKKSFKAAVMRTGLPSGTIMYTLRHSVITDLVSSGLDLLATAQIAGTSVRMIEKHYGHLKNQVVRAALEKLTA